MTKKIVYERQAKNQGKVSGSDDSRREEVGFNPRLIAPDRAAFPNGVSQSFWDVGKHVWKSAIHPGQPSITTASSPKPSSFMSHRAKLTGHPGRHMCCNLLPKLSNTYISPHGWLSGSRPYPAGLPVPTTASSLPSPLMSAMTGEFVSR